LKTTISTLHCRWKEALMTWILNARTSMELQQRQEPLASLGHRGLDLLIQGGPKFGRPFSSHRLSISPPEQTPQKSKTAPPERQMPRPTRLFEACRGKIGRSRLLEPFIVLIRCPSPLVPYPCRPSASVPRRPAGFVQVPGMVRDPGAGSSRTPPLRRGRFRSVG
jgi:hypothetical protein